MKRGRLVAVVAAAAFAFGGMGCAMLVMSHDQGKVHSTQVILKETERDLVRLRTEQGGYPSELQAVDGWGHPIQLDVPGPKGQPYALVSYGADGAPGGRGRNADISNWEI